MVLPKLLTVCKQNKREKLLQYAERVWGIMEGDSEQRIDAAIEQTRNFFEQMQVKTRLYDYGIGKDIIPHLLEQLQTHGMIFLGEQKDITPNLSRIILESRL